MGFLDSIERLINEHVSAAILKERITFLNQQHAAVVSENLILKTENKVLKFENNNFLEQVRNFEKQNELYKHIDSSKYTIQWGCLKFENDQTLYCPSCFFEKQRKIPTSRVNSSSRFCSACKLAIPS